MQSKEKPVTLIYKGSITQSTGEDWDDVPLTLETASPTFGIGVPTLTPWTISVYRPNYSSVKYKAGPGDRFRGGSAALYAMPSGGAPPPAAPMASRAMDMDFLSSSSEGQMQHRGLHVSSKGNVSATFGIPGLINIPSDGVGHNVTIAKLELDASMSWVCVPKKDGKVHLKVLYDMLIKRWWDTHAHVNRPRSRMPPSTPSSLEVPVYTSMAVSSPSQMYHSSAQTRVSTVPSGMFSHSPQTHTHTFSSIKPCCTGSTPPSESPITHAPKTCLNLDSTPNQASTLSASASQCTTPSPPEAPSPAPLMRSKSKSSTKCRSPRTPLSPLSSSSHSSCCPLQRAPGRSARRRVRRLGNSRCRRR